MIGQLLIYFIRSAVDIRNVEDGARQQPMQPQNWRGWFDLNKGTYTNNFWPKFQNMVPQNGQPMMNWFSRFGNAQPGYTQPREYSNMNRNRNMFSMNPMNGTMWNSADQGTNTMNGMEPMSNPSGMNGMNGMSGFMNRMNWGNGMNGFQQDPWYTPRGMVNSWNNMMPNGFNSSLVKVFKGMVPGNSMTGKPQVTSSENVGGSDIIKNESAMTTTTASSVA